MCQQQTCPSNMAYAQSTLHLWEKHAIIHATYEVVPIHDVTRTAVHR